MTRYGTSIVAVRAVLLGLWKRQIPRQRRIAASAAVQGWCRPNVPWSGIAQTVMVNGLFRSERLLCEGGSNFEGGKLWGGYLAGKGSHQGEGKRKPLRA